MTEIQEITVLKNIFLYMNSTQCRTYSIRSWKRMEIGGYTISLLKIGASQRLFERHGGGLPAGIIVYVSSDMDVKEYVLESLTIRVGGV